MLKLLQPTHKRHQVQPLRRRCILPRLLQLPLHLSLLQSLLHLQRPLLHPLDVCHSRLEWMMGQLESSPLQVPLQLQNSQLHHFEAWHPRLEWMMGLSQIHLKSKCQSSFVLTLLVIWKTLCRSLLAVDSVTAIAATAPKASGPTPKVVSQQSWKRLAVTCLAEEPE